MTQDIEDSNEVLRSFILKEQDGIVWGGVDYEPVIDELMRRRMSDEYAAALAFLCKLALLRGGSA